MFFLPTLYALEFHPIIGYEKVHKTYPTEHTNSRLIYGLRVLVGPKILSAEIEGTTGEDTETFPDQNIKVKEKVYNGMLGLRSGVDLGLLSVFARAGGHVRKQEVEKTENGVTTIEKPSARISPYAGAGLMFGSGPLKANAGVTAIFTDRPNNGDIEYQYTLGLGLGF